MNNVYWSTESKNDIDKIIDFTLIKCNPQIVSNFLDNLDQFVSLISTSPKTFPVINRDLGIRKCVISRHNSIFYFEENDRIFILRVYDNRQNPDNLKFN